MASPPCRPPVGSHERVTVRTAPSIFVSNGHTTSLVLREGVLLAVSCQGIFASFPQDLGVLPTSLHVMGLTAVLVHLFHVRVCGYWEIWVQNVIRKEVTIQTRTYSVLFRDPQFSNSSLPATVTNGPCVT